MPILFKCPHCKNRINVPRSAAGLRGECQECGKTIMVPVPGKRLNGGLAVDDEDGDDPFSTSPGRVSLPRVAAGPVDVGVVDDDPFGPPARAKSPPPAAPPRPAASANPVPRVRITDVEIPFDRMVVILIQFGFASFFASLVVIFVIGFIPFLLWMARPK